MTESRTDDIFPVLARRCRRCGGLLTSARGLRDGVGDCCRRKDEIEQAEEEMRRIQTSLFDQEGGGNGAF